MKKIALFMAFAAFSLTSCSNDDDKSNAPALTTGYLQGAWIETIPAADMHTLAFQGNTATLRRQQNTIGQYAYQISGNKLLLSTQGGTAPASEHVVTIVNDSVMRLGNFMITGPADNSIPSNESMTFKRLHN